ncbi:MAG: hypothetical protein JWP35_4403 [Caulobacter sp.]|nr:hypothetical protein [Caulobacter sp.]
MSSDQLEERQAREFAQRVADALGITLADLDETEWDYDENTGSDGALHGYVINFAEGSSPEVLSKIAGLTHGRWIQIGPVL